MGNCHEEEEKEAGLLWDWGEKNTSKNVFGDMAVMMTEPSQEIIFFFEEALLWIIPSPQVHLVKK